MDFNLRCNSLKCRAQLTERAVVTTCSHIFCVACASASALSNTTLSNRVCPACDTGLTNSSDVAVSTLNPGEDYKSSLLIGLNPSNIIECAGRALEFFTYQATQEIHYQEHLSRCLTEKYNRLNSQLDQVIEEANSEIMTLRNKVAALQTEQEGLHRKNNSLREAYNEKVRQNQKIQAIYDKLKKRLVESDVRFAAEDAVEHTLSNRNHIPTLRQHGFSPISRIDFEANQSRRNSRGSYDSSKTSRAFQQRFAPPFSQAAGKHSPSFLQKPQHQLHTRLPLGIQTSERNPGWKRP